MWFKLWEQGLSSRETREMGQVMIKASNHSCGRRRSFKEVGDRQMVFLWRPRIKVSFKGKKSCSMCGSISDSTVQENESRENHWLWDQFSVSFQEISLNKVVWTLKYRGLVQEERRLKPQVWVILSVSLARNGRILHVKHVKHLSGL